jgi:hypothetical protein
MSGASEMFCVAAPDAGRGTGDGARWREVMLISKVFVVECCARRGTRGGLKRAHSLRTSQVFHSRIHPNLPLLIAGEGHELASTRAVCCLIWTCRVSVIVVETEFSGHHAHSSSRQGRLHGQHAYFVIPAKPKSKVWKSKSKRRRRIRHPDITAHSSSRRRPGSRKFRLQQDCLDPGLRRGDGLNQLLRSCKVDRLGMLLGLQERQQRDADQ